MLTTGIIAFREFLEAFLIVGVFLGISRKLKLKKELEIGLAAALGVVLSLVLSIVTYTVGDRARHIFNVQNAEFLENYLLVFSGLFISYVIFSLHKTMRRDRGGKLLIAHKKLQENAFDLSLFFTIVFMVFREGFEIALFTASVSLFSDFMQNVGGLLLGFAGAAIVGISTFFAYIKLPIGKVFKYTGYLIILLGAALTQIGITELFELYFNIHISDLVSFHLFFLPDEHSVVGHFIRSFTGLDREFSLARLGLMAAYIGVIYILFMRQKTHIPPTRRENSV
ncbi:FTR1 family protein [Candidatus Microgenomates bacterium]|nr:FTR1 family protein [Candidatus Microgenomates bacterium]